MGEDAVAAGTIDFALTFIDTELCNETRTKDLDI